MVEAREAPAASVPIGGLTAPIHGAPQATSPTTRIDRPGHAVFAAQAPAPAVDTLSPANPPLPSVVEAYQAQRLANVELVCTSSQYRPGARSTVAPAATRSSVIAAPVVSTPGALTGAVSVQAAVPGERSGSPAGTPPASG